MVCGCKRQFYGNQNPMRNVSSCEEKINAIDKHNNNTLLACNGPLSSQVKTLNKLITAFKLFDQYNSTEFDAYDRSLKTIYDSFK